MIGAVNDLFTGAWDMIKAVAETVYNLVTGQLDKIYSTVTGWIAQIKMLRAKRADIAADFMQKWDAKDGWRRGRFRGEVLGWVMMTAMITVDKAGDIATYAGAFSRAAGKAGQLALDTLKAFGLGKVAEVAVIVKPVIWTAKQLRAALAFPGRMADGLTDAVASMLSPHVDRIKKLSLRAKRWLFGCYSPCDWDPDFMRHAMRLGDDEIETRAARELGEESWDMDEVERRALDTPERVDPRARGYAIEDLHVVKIEAEGYRRLPDWFKTHDAYRGGEVSTVIEGGKRILVVSRPDVISIKSTWITDPTSLTRTVEGYFESLRGGFRHSRGGVRVEGARKRRLDLIFEEGTPPTPDALHALDQLEAAAGSIDFRWYVMQSGKHVPSATYRRTLDLVE